MHTIAHPFYSSFQQILTLGKYVRDFVLLQQRSHLTALKLRALSSRQYHHDVFRKSQEVERKFQKLKCHTKSAINGYNTKVHRIGKSPIFYFCL
ncbi:hypothetical protein X943_001364 [Babesia divergens]|uniref:Uncharacterized protein n=1 Tax=Babesia divergens TaxID=32595 RepID=A0AAD9GFA9_BABDI|nr:hypothetical protein X943_001364 [Babesia divergens]